MIGSIPRLRMEANVLPSSIPVASGVESRTPRVEGVTSSGGNHGDRGAEDP